MQSVNAWSGGVAMDNKYKMVVTYLFDCKGGDIFIHDQH